jgi:hypothetical protein
MVIPVKIDKNVEKVRARTLSGVKGSAPGAVPNTQQRRDRHPRRELSSIHSAVNLQVRQIQNGVRTFTSPPIIFLPHRYCHPTFLKRSVRSCAVLEVVNAVL